MIFQETRLDGAFLIDLDLVEDVQGFRARAWCQREYEAHGLSGYVAQVDVTRTRQKGLIRGIHYHLSPYAVASTVRCTRGGIYDVVVDLRPHSRTYRQWLGVELTEGNCRMLYVPEGCGNGYQALTDVAEVACVNSEFCQPSLQRGVRFDDPAFSIQWPLDVCFLSEDDAAWPPYGTVGDAAEDGRPPARAGDPLADGHAGEADAAGAASEPGRRR